MIEENFQLESSEMNQNERLLEKSTSIVHHMVKENFQFKSSEIHQNEGFWYKRIRMITGLRMITVVIEDDKQAIEVANSRNIYTWVFDLEGGL